MYAGVPFHNLRKIAQEIARDMPAPRTLWGAWREMRAVWKRQQTCPEYQFDTPMPNEALSRAETLDRLADSPDDLRLLLAISHHRGCGLVPKPLSG